MGGFFSGTNQGKSNIRIIDDNGEEVFGINTIHFSNGNVVKDKSGKVRITSKGGGGGGSGDITGTLSEGQVVISKGSKIIEGDPNFTYDKTKNILSVGGKLKQGFVNDSPIAVNSDGEIIKMELNSNNLLTFSSGELTAVKQSIDVSGGGNTSSLESGNTLNFTNTSDVLFTSNTNKGDVNVSSALSPTGITNGTYGNSRSIPQITVDLNGRLTDATNVNISPRCVHDGGWNTGGGLKITEIVNLVSSTDEKVNLNSFNYFTPIADDAQAKKKYEISGDNLLNSTAITLEAGERFTLVGGISIENVAQSIYSTAQYNSNIGGKEFEGEGNLQTNSIYFTTNLNFTGVDSTSISASIGQNLFDSINIEAVNGNTLRTGGQLSTVKCILACKFSIGRLTTDIILIESATAGRSGPTCFTLSMASGGKK